jgi:hypothetical protein
LGCARWATLHYRLQDAWGTSLLAAAVRLFDLRLEIDEQGARLVECPYLLLLRHASTGDTLPASALVGRPHGIRIRYVLKRELLWDPCLDVVGNRLPTSSWAAPRTIRNARSRASRRWPGISPHAMAC